MQSKDKNKKNPYNILSFNDFEKEYNNWTKTTEQIDSLEAYSGNRSLKLDSMKIYSPVYAKKFSAITNSKKCNFRISLYSKFEQGSEPIIVFSTSRKTKNVIWQGENMNLYCYHPQNWCKAYLIKEIYSEIEPNDIVEIYVWNNSKKSIWIDDVKIEVLNIN